MRIPIFIGILYKEQMKKYLVSIAATTAFWAVVFAALWYFDFFVLLSVAHADAIDLQTNQMANAIESLLQALWTCKHSV